MARLSRLTHSGHSAAHSRSKVRCNVADPRSTSCVALLGVGHALATRMLSIRTLVVLPCSLIFTGVLGCSSNDPSPSSEAAVDASTDARADQASLGTTSLGGGFSARSASFRLSRSTKGEHVIDILLSDTPSACAAKRETVDTEVLHLTLRSEESPRPGNFNIVDDLVMGGTGPGPQGTATFWRVRDNGADKCLLSNADRAVLGTVTLTAVSEAGVEGVVDLIGGRDGAVPVQGSFVADPCRKVSLEDVGCPLFSAR